MVLLKGVIAFPEVNAVAERCRRCVHHMLRMLAEHRPRRVPIRSVSGIEKRDELIVQLAASCELSKSVCRSRCQQGRCIANPNPARKQTQELQLEGVVLIPRIEIKVVQILVHLDV